MRRLVQTIALAAALVALALGVWRDYGAFTALKRAVVAYLVAYFLAGGLGLATRAALSAVRDPEPEPEPEPERPRGRRKRRAARTPTAAGGTATAAPAAAEDETEAAVPAQAD